MDTNIQHLGECLLSFNKNAEFSCGTTYNSINWVNTDITKPTYEEVKSEETKIIQDLPFKKLRMIRDGLLQKSDVYGLSDFPFTNETKKQEWMTYRSNLRNLPSNSVPKLDSNNELYDVTWPSKPLSH
tara:strand:- start:13 stop:396 length:384 start_codon:yes stop_codon:yes gene_type:complete